MIGSTLQSQVLIDKLKNDLRQMTALKENSKPKSASSNSHPANKASFSRYRPGDVQIFFRAAETAAAGYRGLPAPGLQ